MTISENGLNLIKKYEGLSLEPYLCPAKIPTIGYGSTYYEDGTKVSMSDSKITEEFAEELLRYNLNKVYSSAVNRYVSVEINQNQFDALVSFAYNLGTYNLKHSTLLRKLNGGDTEGAAMEFFRWNKSKGKVLLGLTKRREEESKLFSTTS